MGTNRHRIDGASPSGRRDKASDPIPRRHKPVPKTAFPISNTNPSVNALKSKIRALNRVLEHDENLPPGVRIEKERALAGYKQDLENAQEAKKTKSLIGRYHMVRFFERRKATRNLNKAKKRLQASKPNTPEHTSALKAVHIAEVDLNYTLYSPLNTKYESIYRHEGAKTDKPIDLENIDPRKSRPAMWNSVKSCMTQDALEALRDGKWKKGVSIDENKTTKKHTKGSDGGSALDQAKSQSSKKPRPNGKDGDDDSDGGFFEE